MNIPDIADVVSKYLTKADINTPYIPYFEKIQEYLSWYRGDTDFHKYKRWNGKKKVDRTKKSLNMAKMCCEDLASLIGVEKLDITFADENAKKYVDRVFENNGFKVNAPQLLELMFALGDCAFVPTVQGDEIKIDYEQGDMIFPLSYDNGKINEIAFASVGGKGKDTAYTLEMYTKNNIGGYDIKEIELTKQGKIAKLSNLANITEKQIEEAEITQLKISRTPFAYCKTNIVNNYDKTSPLGMSVFGNAINVMKTIDETFDSLYNEFKEGKKRIFVKSDLKSIIIADDNFDGAIKDTVDANDTEFYQVGTDKDWNENKPPIYESNMTLRTAEHQQALEILLNIFSKSVGLGEHFYTFDKGGVQTTATAVISAKSDLFRNIKKQELMFGQCIINLCRIILELSNNYLKMNFDVEQDITVNFDDSIIEDTEKTQQEAMAEYNAGLIDKVEYFAITRKMTREQATTFVQDMEATNTMKEFGGMVEDFGTGEQ